MADSIVILGAGWTGLPLAHKLLKYTLPKKPIKVTLVTPNTHFFWNVAATRGLVPGAFTESQLFLPIEPGFARYPSESFEFVLGKADAIHPEAHTVSVLLLNKNGGGSTRRDVHYDHLVIATGSRVSNGMPLKPMGGTHDETLSAWRALRQRIGGARDIVVAGSGPTGVEVAGELAAAAYSTQQRPSITLIMSGDKLLQSQPSLLPSVRDTVEAHLVKLGVKLIRGKRVTHAIKGDATTKLSLSDGTELTTDCYLPLFGLDTNVSFVPAEWLDGEGNVAVDDHLRVAAAGAGSSVWAIGDAGSMEPKQITITDNQIIYLAAALDAVLTGSQPAGPYTPEKKTLVFISLGKSHATGQVGNWKLFGFLVSWVKGRHLFTDKAEAYVQGKQLRHSSL